MCHLTHVCFPQRRECGGCFPGGGKKDLPEHSGWQPGPERGRIGGPAQALCSSGRPVNQRSTASEGRMRLLMTNTTYTTFSSPLNVPLLPSLHPASSFPDLQGGVSRGRRTQATPHRLDCLQFFPSLSLSLSHLVTSLSFIFQSALPEYRLISDTGQRYEMHQRLDGGMMVFSQRSVVLLNIMNFHKTSVRTENMLIPRSYWPRYRYSGSDGTSILAAKPGRLTVCILL